MSSAFKIVMCFRLAALCLLWVSVLPIVKAAPGDIDLSFDPGSGVDNAVRAIVLQPDGKILIGGDFTTVRDLVRVRVARLEADGRGDSSFVLAEVAGPNVFPTVRSLAGDSDGNVLLSGVFTLVNGIERINVARLKPDGGLDPSFDPGTAARGSEILSLAVQSDHKVLIGGQISSVGNVARSGIARLNSDGTLDTSFVDAAVLPNRTVRAIAVQPDGRILIGGDFTMVGGSPRARIARLNSDGTLDPTFNPGNGANNSVFVITLQPDGKALIGGNFTTINGTNRSRIARLSADGTLDPTFNVVNLSSGTVQAIRVQEDGKIFIGGAVTSLGGATRNGVARVNPDGSADPTFNPATGASVALALAIQPDGKLLMGGSANIVDGVNNVQLTRFNPDGSADPGFHAATGPNAQIDAIGLRSDGKVMVTPAFSGPNNPHRGVARLNADGSLDPLFLAGPRAQAGFCIAVQPDGKVLIGDEFTEFAGVRINRIARLDPSGTVDPTFDPGTGPNYTIDALALQPDGKVLIGGAFATISGVEQYGIARINPDGSVDTTFDPGTGASNRVKSVALQADGKVLIGGIFDGVNGYARQNVARLNADGSVDTTFDPTDALGTGGTVYAIGLHRPSGKVIVGGTFGSTLNRAKRNNVARLHPDGRLDDSFVTGIGPNSRVRAVAVQDDGKILIGGDFSLVNGIERSFLARLNADGSLDQGFAPQSSMRAGYNLSPYVASIVLQPDGRILVAGAFSAINGVARSFIARLLGDDSPLRLDIGYDAKAGLSLRFLAVPGRKYRLQYKASLSEVNWTNTGPEFAASTDTISLNQAMVGVQGFYRIALVE